jgi:transcription antitermination factor NusG
LTNPIENSFWYVVYTRPRWEKKIASILDSRGIENYCPLNRIQKQWSDRKKIVLEPLFKGYIFIKISESQKWDIKQIAGIINYVYWLGKPAKVKEEEIITIKKFLSEFENVEVTEQSIKISSKVIISQGILMNYNGVVVEVLGNKARVQIDSMGIRLSAILDKKYLTTLE